MERWQEHFRDLFYNSSVVDEAVIEGLPQLEMKHSMGNAPTMEEVEKAVTRIKNGKAPVHIQVELMKTGCVNVRQVTFDLIVQNWGEAIPKDLIDGILMPLYKSKGERSVCDNHCGITLLESVGKVLARVLLNRLQEEICPVVVSESQYGFRSGRGCVDMMFSARQAPEKCIEQQIPLYHVFVDQTKAFDTVHRDAL